MKKLILLITLFCYSITQAQIGVGIYQDPSLAFIKDNHGNTPFTLDIRIEADAIVFGDDYGGMLIGMTFEYADLSDFSFIRYGVQGGYTFAYMPVPFTKGEEEYELILMVGFAAIDRSDPTLDTQLSLELTLEVAYFITDWLSINGKTTLMQRGDLGARWGDKSGSYRPWDWKPNIYLGIKFRIPVYEPTKTAY